MSYVVRSTTPNTHASKAIEGSSGPSQGQHQFLPCTKSYDVQRHDFLSGNQLYSVGLLNRAGASLLALRHILLAQIIGFPYFELRMMEITE